MSPEPQGGAGPGAEAPRAPAPPDRGLDLEPEEMRRLGYRAVDLLVERWAGLGDAPAWRGGTREELEPLLREPAPEEGRPFDEVLERGVRDVLERAGRVDHPRFFAFVPSSPTWPSVLGDFLAAGYNVFQGTWLESAGPSQLELVVLDWFREWLGLPEGAGGLLTSGGSAANLVSVVAAREAAGDPPAPVAYLSDQGHSSMERAARIAGVPPERIRRVATDEAFRMDPAALEAALDEDRSAGRTPLWVGTSAGATNTGAVDPLPELAALCRRRGVWLHVDGAYGGFAALTERGRRALRGVGEADSVTLDPHKWLFQPYEAGCLLVREPARLEAAFRIMPEYLQDTAMGARHVNFADRGLQLTRSFRALKIWLSVQTFGVGRFRRAIDGALDLAETAEARVRRSPLLELLSPAALGVVCFRVNPARAGAGGTAGDAPDEDALEALNRAVQDRIVESGFAMLSSTRLRGVYSLRLCILGHRSRASDVERTLDRIEAEGRELWSLR